MEDFSGNELALGLEKLTQSVILEKVLVSFTDHYELLQILLCGQMTCLPPFLKYRSAVLAEAPATYI